MKTRSSKRALIVAIAVAVGGMLDVVFPRPAHAIIGRPLTPMSYAGVARRTTRRAVYYGAAARPVYPVPAGPVVVW